MIEILWHGRGGQGAFTAARLLGAAYVNEKNQKAANEKYALAFPSFGPERRGAPIRAFTKLNHTPIGDRSQISRADYSIFLDETLFAPDAFSELKEEGRILLNTRRTYDDPRILTIDADRIAADILKLPITNTIMLGAFAALYDDITLEAVEEAVKEGMPERLQKKNIAAIQRAFQEVYV